MLLDHKSVNGKRQFQNGIYDSVGLHSAGALKAAGPARPRNHILSALPQDIWMRVAPHIGHALLIQGRTLYEPGHSIGQIYFPNGGLISLIVNSANGARVESGLVGREGMAGVFEALTDASATQRAIVQIAGTACWLPSAVFRAEFRRGGEFQDWVLRYLQWMNAQAIQCVLCNRLHSVEERLARWLLLVHDRMTTDEIAVTHEAIAHLLGTRRSSITVALGGFEEQSLLRCARGRLEILDAPRLAQCSCECYSALRAQSSLLSPQPYMA